MNAFTEALSALSTYLVASGIPAILILVIGLVVIRLVREIVKKTLVNSKLEQAAHTLIKTAIQVALYVLLALITASKLGIDVTGVVALASVLTLAVSLAVQNLLANVFSGFTLLYTRPFSSGDFVEIAGQGGTVREIGLTYTKLSTADNKVISIPNSNVTAAEIVNYTVLGTRRVTVEIGVSYDAPTQAVLEALREAGNVPTRLEEKEPAAVLLGYGDSAIRYGLYVWSAAGDYWTTLCTVNEKVREVFEARDIEMTYPHLNVHLDK